jgi:hypothetical protein
MKKIILNILPLATIVILLSAFSGSMVHYPSGAPAGYTGSPGDGQNCTHCHGGTASTVQNWITSNVDPSGYLPGQTYTITVTVTGSGNKGFEVSPQDAAGNKYGTIMMGPGCEFAGGNVNYITHSATSNSNPKVWTFQWTAPNAGSGPVTMYGAFAVSKNTTKLSTLVIPENIGTGIADKPAASAISVFPLPANNGLNVRFNLEKEANVRLSLVNTATGIKNILRQEQMSAGDQTIKLDCSSIADGVYILLAEYGGLKHQAKVIIQH